MFKKFKDKLAEEMKQSPARLQASMQQLAQAVVSPALSNSSIQELSASSDNFSLTEEGDETPKNSPARHGFQNVDLTSPPSNSLGLSRRSSVNSVASIDAASLFPIYESPGNMYHLQSDMEQSASEADENISPQLDRVSKDQLYSAYRKVQTKYHKYRGRYTDLANHYREMERVKAKLESLLVETQDKALRRIADLKEQCQLEQQAKAHLEEALRNDIEEKDHVIDTLNTKVRLLQTIPVATISSTNYPEETGEINPTEQQLIDITTESTTSSQSVDTEKILADENIQLKSKLDKLENLITKYKDSLKRNKEKMSEIIQERSIIERDFELSRNSSFERFTKLEDDLNIARNEIMNLREQITVIRKREEESVISLAENKLSIHRELEVKEEQIKELKKELKTAEASKIVQRELEVKEEQIKELKKELNIARDMRESLEKNVERYKSELECLKMSNDQSTDAEKADLVRDLSKGKTEALKLMQKEMQRRVIELEETMGVKCHDEEMKNRELMEKLDRREEDLRSFESETIELRKEAENYREKCEELRNELSSIKDKEYRKEIGNRNVEVKFNEKEGKSDESPQVDNDKDDKTEKVHTFESNSHEKGSKDSTQSETMEKTYENECEKLKNETIILNNECEKLRKNLTDTVTNLENSATRKDEIIQQLSTKVEQYQTAIQGARERLEVQQNEIKSFQDNNSEIEKLREDLENKTVEILGITSELKSCKSTTNDLREKIRNDTETINLLTKEKICLISNILEYKKRVNELKQYCDDVRIKINEFGETRNDEFNAIQQTMRDKFDKYSKTLEKCNENDIKRLKDTMENELTERNQEIEIMRDKVKRWDETNRKNNKLIAEIDSLNFKIFDLEKLKIELDDSKKIVECLRDENLQLKKCNEISNKLKTESEDLENIVETKSKELQNLSLTNEELRKDFKELENVNLRLKSDYNEDKSKLEAKCAQLVSNLEEIKLQYEDEKKNAEEQKLNADIEVSKMKTQHDNRENLIANCTEKIKYFQAECAKRDEGLEKLRVTMEKREKMLEETILQSKTFETEIGTLSEMKLRLETQLEKREQLLNMSNEKLRNFEIEITKITEENLRLLTEIDKREKIIENINDTLKNVESDLSRLSEEKSRLESCEELLAMSTEKFNDLEANFSRVSEDKLKLEEEIKKRVKSEEDMNEKLMNLENEFTKLAEDKLRITEELEKLKTTSTEFEGSNETLKETINTKNTLLKKLKALKERQASTIQDNTTKIAELEGKIIELEAKSQDFIAEKSRNDELSLRITELEATEDSLRKNIQEFESTQTKLTEVTSNHDKLNENLEKQISESSLLRQELEKLQLSHKETKEMCNELEKINNNLLLLKEEMSIKIKELENICVKREEEINILKNVIKTRDNEFEKLGESHKEILENEEKLRINLEENYRKRFDKLENELQLKLKQKEEEQGTILGENQDDFKELVQQLQIQLQDKESKLLSSQTKSSQIQIINEELKTQSEKLKQEMETIEAEQSMRLKQLVKEFQAQLHDKDEELQAALEKRFESQQSYESDLVQQYREQLKDFQVELTTKSEQIENLVVENKDEVALKSKEMEKLIETIGNIKQEHANEIRDIEIKWKAMIKHKSEQLEAKHNEDVSELTREWQNERRNDDKSDESPQELESTSRVAMAAVQSNTGSLHSLQQTLVSQRRELAELRKLVKLRQDTLDDSTEIEYLRNILYEYMMGRETVVLARVIAAVVKFDQEQTTRILKKEEDKLTLLGSLGLT